MKKKVLAAFLTVCLLPGTAAYAVDTEVDIENRTVTITDKIEPNSEAIMIAVKAGGDLKDDEAVFAVRYSVSDEKGTVGFSFDMPEERNAELTDGEYDIYTKQNGEILRKTTIVYTSEKTRVEFIEKLQDRNNWADLLNDTNNEFVLKAIGCYIDEYYRERDNSEQILLLLTKYMESFEKIDYNNFSKAFNKAVFTQKINNSASERIQEYLEILDLEFDNELFSDIEENSKKIWLGEGVYKNKSYASVEDFEKMYKKVNELYIINSSREDKISKVLSDYATDLGLDLMNSYEKYLNLNNKNKANEYIASQLKKNPAYTVDDLKDAIEKSLSYASENTNSTSGKGGGSGSGSSGGFGGGSKINGVSSAIPAEQNNKPEKETITIFSDLEEATWAAEAIQIMAQQGILSGDENGKFRPNDTIKREEFVRMLVVAAGVYDENAECELDDVSPQAWYYKSIASAYNAGLVYGTSESIFGVGTNITRQDMMVLCRRAEKDGTKLEQIREYEGFDDEAEIADYAKEAIKELYMAGIANGMGDGVFCPQETATRAQGALMIYNMLVK